MFSKGINNDLFFPFLSDRHKVNVYTPSYYVVASLPSDIMPSHLHKMVDKITEHTHTHTHNVVREEEVKHDDNF